MPDPVKPRPGFSFLVCPDSELIKQEIEKLLAKYSIPNNNWQKYFYWGDNDPDEDFWEKLSRQGLFAEKRAVIVRQANNWKASVWKAISQVLSKANDAIWAFFCLEVDCEKGKFKIPAHILKSRCMIFAEKNGWVWKDPGLEGAPLRNFIKKQAASKGLALAPAALELLCANLQPSAKAVINELEKLSLYCGDGQVGMESVQINSINSEANAFSCIKKLEQGKSAEVWREIGQNRDQGLMFALVTLLARELRTLWQILAGESVYLHPAEASFKKNLARGMGITGIANAFSVLADAEWQVKSGAQTPEQTLDYLCVEMTRLFKNRNIP